MSKKAIITLVAAVSCFWLLLNSFVEEVPGDLLTRTHMHVIRDRLIDHYNLTGCLPDRLTDLPNYETNRTSSLMDAWGHSIGYRVENAIVTLESFGLDGHLGGTGLSQDIFLYFDPGTSEMLFDPNTSEILESFYSSPMNN